LEPKTIIQEIRREYTGEGLTANRDWKSVVNNSNEALNEALKHLSENLYKKKFHFIMELIQNAEDNQYLKKEKPSISFTLLDDRLVVRNNETGFSEQNVRAICKVGKSTKKKIEGYIGEKGIGFKSVFKVSESPEIYSNDFRFKFRSGLKTKNQLGYILPEWIDDIPEYVDSQYTNIVLPFKKNNPDEFRRQLNQIHPNLLLFLKKINNIVISDNSTNEKRILQKKVLKDGIVMVSEHKEKYGTSYDSNEYYYYLKPFSYKVNTLALSGSDERKGLKTTEIIIGFPLQKIKGSFSLLTKEDCSLYSYLPIKDVGFRFLIHADFILNSSREDIDEAKSWNDWILAKISISIKDSLLSLRSSPYWKNYLQLLPRENDISDDTFSNLAHEVITAVKNEKIVPIYLSDELNWILPSKAIKYNALVENVFNNDWIRHCIKKQLFHPLAIITSDVCKTLGIDVWEWEYTVSCLKNPHYISAIDVAKRNKLYAYLSDRSTDSEDLISELKDLPIFFIKGAHVPQSFNQSDDGIFWPVDSHFNYSFLEALRFLTSNFQENKSSQKLKIRNFFNVLGVRNASIKSIIKNYLIPKYSERIDGNLIGQHLSKFHLELFRFLVENYSTIKKDLELLKLIKENIILLSDSNKKYNRPSELYLNSAYQKTVDWEKFLIGESVCYLSPAYKSNLKSPLLRDALKFLEGIGVRQIASVNHLIDVFNSKNASKIRNAINYLDSNWYDFRHIAQINSLIIAIVIPANNELTKPSDIFFPSKRNRQILKNTVSYLPGIFTNKDFIIDIGVNVNTIPYPYLIRALASLKNSKIKDRRFLTMVYKEFRKEKDLVDIFNEEKLIYCFYRKKWIHSWDAVWSIEDDNFNSFFSEIESQYPSLRVFFTDYIDINLNIGFSNIKNYFSSLSGNEQINDSVRRNIECSLIFIFYQLSKNKISINEINELKELQCIPDQYNFLVKPNNAYFADDLNLYSVFKDSEISFFKLSSLNSGFRNYLKSDFSKFGMKSVSKAVISAIHSDDSFVFDKNLTNELSEIVNAIIYVIFYRFKDIYNELPETIRHTKNLRCSVGEHISVNYSLDSFSRVLDEDVFIKDTAIYVKRFDRSFRNDVFEDLLFKFFSNTEEIKDIIIYLVGISDADAFYKYLRSHGIPVPKSKSDLLLPKKTKRLSIIDDYSEDQEPDESNTDNDSEKPSHQKEREKRIVVVPQWEPETNPDFLVTIDDLEESDHPLIPFDSSASSGKNNVFFPSYHFIKNNANEYEIGDWGESFVFNNLVAQLKKQFPKKNFKYKSEKAIFSVFDKNNVEVASLTNGNADTFTQSGYDFLKIIEGKNIFIEVKSTTSIHTGKFILKKEQWNCCRSNPDNYELYFVKGTGSKKASIHHVPDFFHRYEKGLINVIPHDLEIII